MSRKTHTLSQVVAARVAGETTITPQFLLVTMDSYPFSLQIMKGGGGGGGGMCVMVEEGGRGGCHDI